MTELRPNKNNVWIIGDSDKNQFVDSIINMREMILAQQEKIKNEIPIQ